VLQNAQANQLKKYFTAPGNSMGKWMIQAWVHSGLHSVDVAFFKCNEALDRAKKKRRFCVSTKEVWRYCL